MEFHGADDRSWVKLGATAKPGDVEVALSEPVTGWKAGDRVILTATRRDESESGTRRPGKRNRKVFTEERTIKSVDGAKVTIDAPLDVEHLGAGETRGEIANLSRNVVVESAEPEKMRGHTMYHRIRRARSRTPSSATWGRRTCWASTACTSTSWGTRCAARR
jgi:hypothetical protein